MTSSASHVCHALCRRKVQNANASTLLGVRALRSFGLGAVLVLLVQAGELPAEVPADSLFLSTNHVLELDGHESYLELPPNIFNDLTEATVEGWVRWKRLGNWMRFFDFGKQASTMLVGNFETTADLRCELWDASGALRADLRAIGVLEPGRWCHISVTTGPTGAKLYFNGVLAAASTYPGSFAEIQHGEHNFLGRNNWWGNVSGIVEDLAGQIDEVRVWRKARSQQQIQEHLFGGLTGSEPDLVGWWNFEHVAGTMVQDGSVGGHGGRLVGNAKVVASSLPAAAELVRLEPVLEFAGPNAYVELPPNIFNDLTEATVETWARWDTFAGTPKRIFNYGDALRDLSLSSQNVDDLWFVIVDPVRGFQQILVPRLLRLREWCHIAASCGPGGMKLYFNGALVGTHPYQGSFAALGNGMRNYIGQRVTTNDPSADFQGQLAEFRIWRTERTAEQIRANMFEHLTGSETGLAGLWTGAGVENQKVPDLTPAAHHGQLIGPAHAAASRLPKPGTLPVQITGAISSPAGGPATDTIVLAVRDGHAQAISRTDQAGNYRVQIEPPGGLFHLLAVKDKALSRSREFLVSPFSFVRFDWSLDPAEAATNLKADAAGLFAEYLAEPKNPYRQEAAEALRRLAISQPRVVSALVRGLQDPSGALRAQASAGLQQLPIPDELRPIYEKTNRAMAFLFGGLLIPFFVFHLLLFIFFPQATSNLYYALFVGAAVTPELLVLAYSGGETGGVSTALSIVSSMAIALTGVRLLYSLFYAKLPRQFWVFLGVVLLSTSALILRSSQIFALLTRLQSGFSVLPPGALLSLAILGSAVLVLAALWAEMFRVIILAVVRRKQGSRIIGLGFLCILGFVLFPAVGQVLFNRLLFSLVSPALVPYLPKLGTVGFVACASIYLARNFAEINRGLLAAKSEIEAKNSMLEMTNLELQSAKQSAELAREAADEANRAKSQFLANMSHELRTPLNAIIGYSEMLQEVAQEDGHDAYVPDLEKIQAAARHQLGLVNDILDLSKIEAGKMTLLVEEFDVAKLVHEVATTVQPLVEKNKNRFEVDCPTGIGSMRSDSTKVRQVLFNLLSNACKFTDRGIIRLQVLPSNSDAQGPNSESPIRGIPLPPPVIQTYARGKTENGPRITFHVSDTGIGMTPEQLGRVFQAFIQADASTSKKYGGTGLGLALCQKFCEMLDGELSVQSELGKGSVFTVRLPAALPSPPVADSHRNQPGHVPG